ncbi:MAG: single-stranded-DNA-specific exonuclease RecJ [Blastocatellia bacterium]
MDATGPVIPGTPDPVLARGLAGTRWTAAACDETLLRRLRDELGEPELIVRCLLNRGVNTADAMRTFLAPDFKTQLLSPFLLRDMRAAAARLHQAVQRRERILVVTDFDVDGTTSSVILTNVLRLIGGGDLVECYIPDRFTEGYGLSESIVEKAAAQGISVIVTADIGIKSHQEARRARALGIDLIICDHHLPDGEDVPAEAYAVLCPKGSSGTGYPNKDLAACGVALKLADALLENHEKREAILASLAKLTAIGTIADLVDLSVTENRAIVRHGLQALSEKNANPGLRALLTVSGASNPLTSWDVGFKIGPRINAAGRIAHASTVLDLFAAKTDAEAMELARRLDSLNAERQQIQNSLMEKLMRQVREHPTQDRVLLFAGKEEDGFHRGVVGIACSRIVETTGRPVLICAINEEGMAHGSARSIRGFHIVEAMSSAGSLLVKFGGHPMAAGFTIQADRINEFRQRLNDYAAEFLPEEKLGRELTADAILDLPEVTVENIRRLLRLEPHGMGNSKPQFLIRHFPLRDIRVMKDKHLKLLPGGQPGVPAVEAVWWNAAQYQSRLSETRDLSLMANLEINSWNGRETAQIVIRDAAPAIRS